MFGPECIALPARKIDAEVCIRNWNSSFTNIIHSEHRQGRQVFRRKVVEWIQEKTGSPTPMTCRAVGGLLYRLGYRRRRGGIKKPSWDEKRLARIRRFLVEIDAAKKAEDGGQAAIVYMDESFVHQAHASVYSFFRLDGRGEADSAFGRTTGKDQRMTIVHAITKHGPLVTRKDGFPIEEGWFKAKATGRGKQGGDGFKMRTEPTAKFFWQEKSAKGDYHAAMTDTMFMERLEHRLVPAFEAEFPGEKLILVLDNASYHHGRDAEVRVP